jgi:SAM-dependent methyltransferase
MEELSSGKQMAKIRGFEKGYLATHLINMGAKQGIFDVLNEAKDGITVSDLAAKLNLYEPYVRIWCQTAYSLEILDADESERFKLQPFLDEILGDKKSHKNYLANIALTADIAGKGLEQATDYYRTGIVREAFTSPEVSKAAYKTTKNMYLVFLYMIFPKHDQLKNLLDRGINYLDIGCGDGRLIVQMAQAFPNSRFVGIGPDVFGIEDAKKLISKAGLADRVSVINSGGQDIAYENEFDMISLVVTLHEIWPDVREKVMENAHRALKKDGHLLVLDLLYPQKLEDFRNPIFDYGVLDQFYEAAMGTVHLNIDEQNELLSKAGFKNIQRMPIGKGMFDFILANK